MDIISNIYNEYKIPVSLIGIYGCYSLYRYIKRKNIKKDIIALNKLKADINAKYKIIKSDFWTEPKYPRIYKYDIDDLSSDIVKNKYYNDTINYNQIRKHADYIIDEIIKNEIVEENKLILKFNNIIFWYNIKNNTKEGYCILEIMNNIDEELKKINIINNEIMYKTKQLL